MPLVLLAKTKSATTIDSRESKRATATRAEGAIWQGVDIQFCSWSQAPHGTMRREAEEQSRDTLRKSNAPPAAHHDSRG